jgi:hypothetical protein
LVLETHRNDWVALQLCSSLSSLRSAFNVMQLDSDYSLSVVF